MRPSLWMLGVESWQQISTARPKAGAGANPISRPLFSFGFPMFCDPIYHELGIQWAGVTPAFLALACVPLPRLLFNCKFVAEAERARSNGLGETGATAASSRG